MPPVPAQPPVRLYAYAMSPYAAKVHCFLLYKQLEFECYYISPLRVKKELPVGRQIPVVTIDGESKGDSTPIGLWLDERFPDHPRLLPEDAEERERLLKIDDWISHCLIPGSFRSYPGTGLDHLLNGWRLGHVMAKTARGGIPWPLRAGWPLIIRRVAFVRRLLAMADDGLPVRESKLKLYDAFVSRLEGGPFVGGRDTPSMPDLAAYPQFALYYMTGFRGGRDILAHPELMAWLRSMRPHVTGMPPLVPPAVRKEERP